MLQSELLKKVIKVLNDNHIDYMVTGSIVSSLQGEPRLTHDVDIVVNISQSSINTLLKAFPGPRYYLNENSIKEAIQHKSMFNLLDTSEGGKVDFWLLTDDPFDQSRFTRKYEENIFGHKMKASRPEDTILAKLKWAKDQGGSEKQFGDALRVYELQYGNLDLDYMGKWAENLKVSDLLEELKAKSNPLSD